MVQKRSSASTNDPKPKKAKNGTGVAVEELLLAELLDQPARKGSAKASSKRSGRPAGAPPKRLLPEEALAAGGGGRLRTAPAARLSEVVVGFDSSEEPTPIRLVPKGKMLAEGEVYETQSEEIRKEYPQSPIAKVCRAKYNWVAQTDGGRFTRDPSKMLPILQVAGGGGKWTCDVCGKNCSEQLFIFRAFLRKEHLQSLEGRCLDPFVAYIGFKCGRGLLGQLSEYMRFREEVFSLTTKHRDLDEARQQLEDALKHYNREDQQFLVDELERLAGVGPGGAPKTVEMDSVERLVPGAHPAVLLRTPEDVFRAMARTLAPRVGARLLAAATISQLQEEGAEVTGYLHSVKSSLDAGGPLPQAPLRWPLAQVEVTIQAALRAMNGQGERPQLRVELACSWDAKMKAFGPKKADLTLRLGYLQARQALHAFVPGARLQREDAAQLQQRLDAVSGELQPVAAGGLASSLPGMNLRPAPRLMGRAESLGYGWHSSDWAQRLKDLLGVQLDFRQRPLRLATGCSGAEAPHFALQQLVGHEGFEQLWGSEINENPRRFILKNCSCQHLFEDVCYIMEGGGRCARHGGRCGVPQGEVDIFVGGFPCTPYSFCNPKRFKRNCFTEPAAVPFFEMRKFIAERRPRLVILENVRGLLAPNPETDHPPIDFILRGKNPENPEDCYQGTAPNADWGLSLIQGYGLRWDVLYSCDWGLPQSRPRVYIVMVRDDAGGQAAAERIFEVLTACAGRMPRGSCNDFLLEDDHPQLVAALRKAAIKPDQRASGGRRACTKFTEALFRTKRQELGLDPKDRPYSGKRPPGWYPQATEKMVQQLDIIHAVGEKQGLDFNFLLADLSQQVSRGAWRDDGNIPTLTTGSVLYSFSRHRPFLGEECLRLNGFPIEQLSLDAHTEAERIFLAGNAMSVPVVGAVLFAALVSLSWGAERTVRLSTALPEPVQTRPDVRKLTQPGSVVLAQLAPSLMDDECEVITPEDAPKVEEDTALARRAAVLLALTRELTHGTSKKQKAEKGKESKEAEIKSNGLVAAVQGGGPPMDASESPDAAAGDGTGWEARYAKVMERLRAPKEEAPLSNAQLLRWLLEASELLEGMAREERHSAAHELQHFVVKSLQVYRDGSDDAQMAELGLEDVLTKLCNMRFPEAKSLFGRLQVQKLQQHFASKDMTTPDIDWLAKAQALCGLELSVLRAEVLKHLIRQGRHTLGRFFTPLLELWCRESAEDQELQQVQKGVEILRKVWATMDPEDVWSGFAAVGSMRRCCLEIAKNCEGRRRPQSSQIFNDLAQRMHTEILLSRAAVILKTFNVESFRVFIKDACGVEEMGWSSKPSIQSIWNVMCLLLETLKDVDLASSDVVPPPEKELSSIMGYHLMIARSLGGSVSSLVLALDSFLWRLLPNMAMRVHLYEFHHCRQQGRAVEDAKSRSTASLQHFLNWCSSRLEKLTFDFEGWPKVEAMAQCLTDSSSQMNILQKSLGFAFEEMKALVPETDALYKRCCRVLQDSQPQIEAQAWFQEGLARLNILQNSLHASHLDGILGFQEIQQGLREVISSGPGARSAEDVERCLEKHNAKAPPDVVQEILWALKVTLQVPAEWKRNRSSMGLYFFQHRGGEYTQWIWPIESILDALQRDDMVQDLGGGMTPPLDLEDTEVHEVHEVPSTPVGRPPVRPSSGARSNARSEPAFVPSSPDPDDELHGAITPPSLGSQPPPEPLGPPPEPPRPRSVFAPPTPPQPPPPPQPPQGGQRPKSPSRPPPKSILPPPPPPVGVKVWQPSLLPLPSQASHASASASALASQVEAKVPKPPSAPPPEHLYAQSWPDWQGWKHRSW